MAVKNRADLLAAILAGIRSGNSDTTAAELKAILDDLVDSNLNTTTDDSKNLVFDKTESPSTQSVFTKISSLQTQAQQSAILSSGTLTIGEFLGTGQTAGQAPFTLTSNSALKMNSHIISDVEQNAMLITINTDNLGTTDYQVVGTIVSNGNWEIDVSMFFAEVETNQTSFQFALRERSSLIQNIQIKLTLLRRS